MSKPLTYQIVARARQIIADPKHWAQGDYAVFKNGNPAEPHYQRAYRFCAVGALNRAAYELTGELSFDRQFSGEQGAPRSVLVPHACVAWVWRTSTTGQTAMPRCSMSSIGF